MTVMCLSKIKKVRKRKLVIIFILFFVSGKLLEKFLCPSVIPFTELYKCPACFGTLICDDVFSGNINIKPFDFHSTMIHLLSSKNVYFGRMNNQQIVVKKLAHDDELQYFDEISCRNFSELCSHFSISDKNIRNKNPNIDFFASIQSAISSDFINEDKSGLILCPTTGNLIKLVGKVNRHKINYAYLWTMIHVNPEPFILQILPADEGWPVPKYFGACGRIVIEEYVGLPLTAYYHDPWIVRAKIAASLLEAAQMFTFQDNDFSFYLTDLSPENIAIDKHHNARIIDLENIIIVDKNTSAKDQSENWHELHESTDTIDCANCFEFSPADICSHRISDHNYFAVCQHILASQTSASSIPGGFLYNVPKDISSRYPDLKIMLDECSVPAASRTRIEVGDKLRDLLQKVIRQFS